jgi:hypothetical protein
MKRLISILLLLVLSSGFVFGEITDEDLKKVEVVVRREVQSGNEKLKEDLKEDIYKVREEAITILDDMSGKASTTKMILVLAVVGAIVVAETVISFLKFLVWRAKRRLFPMERARQPPVTPPPEPSPAKKGRVKARKGVSLA